MATLHDIIGLLELVQNYPDKLNSLNGKHRHGCTPLHRAVQMNNIALVQELLSSGAKINEKDCNGRIHYIMHHDMVTLRLLKY